jgi:hypothetical protein
MRRRNSRPRLAAPWRWASRAASRRRALLPLGPLTGNAGRTYRINHRQHRRQHRRRCRRRRTFLVLNASPLLEMPFGCLAVWLFKTACTAAGIAIVCREASANSNAMLAGGRLCE